jgi:hypothetical protein
LLYYKNGGNTLPPVALPIGTLRLTWLSTSLPALFSSGGNLSNIPPNKPKSFADLIVGTSPNDLPIVASDNSLEVRLYQLLKLNVIGILTPWSFDRNYIP